MSIIYEIVPENEPNGENTGFVQCKPEEATAWTIYTGKYSEGEFTAIDFIATFDTKDDAEYWFSTEGEEN